MKFALYFFAFFAMILVWHTTSGHLDNTNGCETNCEVTYAPICGTDESGKTKTFSNECVLKSENCIHKTNYQRTASGTCP